MKKTIIILIAAAAAAISCSKAAFEPVPAEGPERLHICGEDNFSKACLTDAFAICWEKDKDEVCVFNKNEKYRYTVTTTGTTAWMEGGPAPTQSTYYALYPYDENASNTTGSITTTLPAEQKAVKGQFSSIVAVSASKTKEFIFQPAVCLVEVDLQTEGVKTISFRGNNGELLAGTLRLSATTSGEPEPTIIKGSKEVSISDGGNVLEPGTYYIAIAPQTFEKGVTITLSGDAGVAEKATAKPVSAARCSRIRTGALALTLVPKDDDFWFEYSDQDISGAVYPGEQKYIIYSYSGTNSLNYTIHSNSAVNIEFPDGTSALKEEITQGGSVIDLLPVAASGGENDNVHRLKAASPRGSEGAPINLTTDNNSLFGSGLSGSNTANCYVVTTPGWYSFPLVYGNAIKNGSTNTDAFAPSVTGVSALSPFIDGTGSPISGPYLQNVASLRLEWEDVVGLIQDISMKANGADSFRAVFQVPQETIREGNAVISALDSSGTVIWSWHIWVCGAPASDFSSVTVTNKAGLNFDMASINVGWVAPYDTPLTYEARNTRVRITQPSSGKVIEFTLAQTGAALPANEVGNCPFYQFGRKDPFVASDGTPGLATENCRKKTWYTTSRRDTIGTRYAELGADIVRTIQNPTVYNMQSGGDGTYANLWNATQATFASSSTADANAQPVVKTVYDPCPIGCCLPPIGAWTAFKENVSGSFDQGYYFSCSNGTNTFYPAAGSMSTSNMTSTKVFAALRNVGTGFSYWAANANNKTAGFNLNVYNGGTVNNTYGSNRQYVYPIRPGIEK